MEKLKFNRSIVVAIIALIIFLVIIIPASKDVYRYMQLPKKGVYSIGKITNIFDDRYSASSINFTFTYQNNTIPEVSKTKKFDRNLIGKKFFVQFLPDHPKTIKILLDKPVPAHIKNAPYEGWKELP